MQQLVRRAGKEKGRARRTVFVFESHISVMTFIPHYKCIQ